jgi:diacylglycerol kinase family enzyme
MLGHAAKRPDLRIIPTSALKKALEPKVAVLLNANARQVSDKVVRSLTYVLPEDDLFLSRDDADLRPLVRKLLDRRYDTVFLGGGDGTFTAFINELWKQLDDRNELFPQRPPRIGMLKLGTGNALASLLKASPLRGDGILDDVLRARAGEVPGFRRVDVLLANGSRAVMAGMGLDGQVLNDFVAVKRAFSGGPLAKVMSGAGGYFTSVTFRSLPALITQPAFTQARVVNGPSAAFRIGPNGETVEELAPGAVLFEGKINFVGAGTAPFVGYEFKLFPYAGRRRGMMQLRLAACTGPEVLWNLPSLWKGDPTDIVRDFHTAGATIELERPMPLQIGGDGAGYHSKLELGMAAESVELVDFNGSVH